MLQLNVHSQMGQEPSSFDHINGHFIFANQSTHSPPQIVHWNTEEDLLSVRSGLMQCLWVRSYLFTLKPITIFPPVLRAKQSLPHPQIHSLPFVLLCALGGQILKTASRWYIIGFSQWIALVGNQKPEGKSIRDVPPHHLLGLAWFWDSDSSHQEALLPDSSPIGSR